jgi:hypothetical protein
VENVWIFIKTFAAIAAMSAIIPLMVWGGSGSWRHALYAWKSWAKVMGGFALVGGGLGLLMAISEHGISILWLVFSH